MYLTHFTDASTKNILKILKDGYLRPSIKTKNKRLFGRDLSEYIYLMIEDKDNNFTYIKPGAVFYLDINLLLRDIFYLSEGWYAENIKIKTKKIDGKKITEDKLIKKLKNFIKKMKKKDKTKVIISDNVYMDRLFSHEIKIKKDIPLDKYLIKIELQQDKDNKIKKYIKKKYPNVVVKLKKN